MRLALLLVCLFALATSLAVSGCFGGGLGKPLAYDSLVAGVAAPNKLIDGASSHWTVSWLGGRAPYHVKIAFTRSTLSSADGFHNHLLAAEPFLVWEGDSSLDSLSHDFDLTLPPGEDAEIEYTVSVSTPDYPAYPLATLDTVSDFVSRTPLFPEL